MLRPIWFIVMLVALLSHLSATAGSAAAAGPQAAVATEGGMVRSAPSTTAAAVDELDPGDVFAVVGTVKGEQVAGGSSVWLETAYGHYVYSGVAKIQGSGATYIDVDRETRTAVAVQNGTIVHTAAVVLGMPGWRTPVGNFTITQRVANDNMDSTVLGIPVNAPGGFSYDNIQYVQYVNGAFALHTNYWVPDSAFGQADLSHGCVGMRLEDARFFWDFADIGTTVYVHD